jgi:hypothetical protein
MSVISFLVLVTQIAQYVAEGVGALFQVIIYRFSIQSEYQQSVDSIQTNLDGIGHLAI